MEPTTTVAQQNGISATATMLIGLIVGLFLGGAGGWYIGYMMQISSGMAQMIGLPVSEQTEEMPQAMQLQADAQMPVVESPEAGNPLQDLETNPYADVKVNPFDE